MRDVAQREAKRRSRKHENFAELTFCQPYLVFVVVSFVRNADAHQITYNDHFSG